MLRRLDAVDVAVRESTRLAGGPRCRDGVHSTQEDDVGDVAAELPRPPPPDSDEDEDGVELVDLNRAPAPAVATDSPRE